MLARLPSGGALARLRLGCALALLLAGCAIAKVPKGERPQAFVFQRDTLAFANELYWEYAFDDTTGVATSRPRPQEVRFGNRCAPMARAIRQFYYGARFDPALAPLSEEAYRERVRRILAGDPRSTQPAAEPVVIPGYEGLRAFSREHEEMLKQELGGRSETYLQRGNLRVVFPFLAEQQRETAQELLGSIRQQRPAILHLVVFPRIELNHTLLAFAAEETPREIRFEVFDPNHPEAPLTLSFRRAEGAFSLPRTAYFAGGKVHAYEIYDGLF